MLLTCCYIVDMYNLKWVPILQTLLNYYKILLKINFNELFAGIFNNGNQFIQQNHIISLKQIKLVTLIKDLYKTILFFYV